MKDLEIMPELEAPRGAHRLADLVLDVTVPVLAALLTLGLFLLVLG